MQYNTGIERKEGDGNAHDLGLCELQVHMDILSGSHEKFVFVRRVSYDFPN